MCCDINWNCNASQKLFESILEKKYCFLVEGIFLISQFFRKVWIQENQNVWLLHH
jgi:hypothetical protein